MCQSWAHLAMVAHPCLPHHGRGSLVIPSFGLALLGKGWA